MDILNTYAHLLVHYCLNLQKGEKLFISTTMLAEPLLREVYREAIKIGVIVEYKLGFAGQNKLFLTTADEDLLSYTSEIEEEIMRTFDAYLVIRAPFNSREDQGIDKHKLALKQKANAKINELYFDRIANGSLKRCLCQFPTQASAQEAGMSLEEYENFVYNACYLFDPNPMESWMKVRANQQSIVDYLNLAKQIRYVNDRTDISFSVDGRTWINSDGRNNMPSGEVFSSPVEDSVEGHIHFDYPTVFDGQDVQGITLEVEKGLIVNYTATIGQQVLDRVFAVDGTRRFGEVAIGTNYHIQRATKNILFDEKIGGTVHMAVGQSYKQTGGKNMSTIHWDMICGMQDTGHIYADGKLIYQFGKFII